MTADDMLRESQTRLMQLASRSTNNTMTVPSIRLSATVRDIFNNFLFRDVFSHSLIHYAVYYTGHQDSCSVLTARESIYKQMCQTYSH